MKLKASKQALENNVKNSKETELGKELETKKAEEVLLEFQRKEFSAYLEKKVDSSDFQFFHDMFKKLVDGKTLTPKMEEALRKCMTRDAEYDAKKNKPVDESELPKVTLKVKQWWMKANNLDSRVISGVVLRETAKALLIKGHADMVDGTRCMRCGRELTEPASMLIGYGETCCSKLGIPYPEDVKTASKKERLAIRKKLLKVLYSQKFELWVPKSQVEEMLEAKGKINGIDY